MSNGLFMLLSLLFLYSSTSGVQGHPYVFPLRPILAKN